MINHHLSHTSPFAVGNGERRHYSGQDLDDLLLLRLLIMTIQQRAADLAFPLAIEGDSGLVHVAGNVLRVGKQHGVFEAVQYGSHECGVNHWVSSLKCSDPAAR